MVAVVMGKSHAQCAGITWVAVLAVADSCGVPITGLGAALSTCAAVAAGVAPDIDHPGSGVTRNLGLVGKVTSKLVRRVAKGHRLLTHTIGSAIGATAVTFAASLYPMTMAAHQRVEAQAGDTLAADVTLGVAYAHRGVMALVLALLVATALDLLPKVSESVEWGAAVLAAASTAAIGDGVAWWLLPAAVAWGWHCHLICDRCTMEPIPYGWPFTDERTRVAWRLFKVNTPAERWVVRGVWLACAAVIVQTRRHGWG